MARGKQQKQSKKSEEGGEAAKNKFYKTLSTNFVRAGTTNEDEQTNSSASVDKKYQKVSVAKCEKNEAKQGGIGQGRAGQDRAKARPGKARKRLLGGNCVDGDIVTVYVAFTFTLLRHVFYDCS